MSARDYDPAWVREIFEVKNGVIFKRERPLSAFWCDAHGRTWNAKHGGKPAHVRLCTQGYRTVRYAKREMLEHRVLWLFHYGEWPKGEVDHINGNRLDNRIENLRDCTKSQNMKNQKLRRDSTSGFPGVHFCRDKKTKPWVARIGGNGTWKTIGYFATREEAIECRKREQVKHGFSDRHGSQVAA